jgi:Zn-finger nucleic acid-binding protein
MNLHARSCPACEVTLTSACVQKVPLPLCGLCRLLTYDDLTQYLARWNPTVRELETSRQENAA